MSTKRFASGACASLFIRMLGWRDAYRGRRRVATLTALGTVLINNDRRGRGIGSGGVRTQRVEACFLLVAKPVIELRERGLHGRHRTVRGCKPLLHGLDAARGRDCRIDRAISLKPFCRLGGHILQFVKRRPLRWRRLRRLGNAVERQVRDRRRPLAAELGEGALIFFGDGLTTWRYGV